MSVQRRRRPDGTLAWRVRWREGERWRSRTFDLKADALDFDAQVRRLRRLGQLATLDAGTETLDLYVTDTWGPAHLPTLAPKTCAVYASVYDQHLAATLGAVPLRDLTPELIARWQADRLAARVAAALGTPRRGHADLPRRRRASVDRARLPVVAAPCLRTRAQGGRRPARATLRPTPFVRLAAAP
jgi:hypothetical protein